MDPLTFGSWSIRASEWTQEHYWPLWIRAAERIDVPARAAVPGPLDIATLPTPTGVVVRVARRGLARLVACRAEAPPPDQQGQLLPAAPFRLEFILLPVLDLKVRVIDVTRYLAPERLYGSEPFWAWLRVEMAQIAAGS